MYITYRLMFRNKIELVRHRDSYLQADHNQELSLHHKNPICFLKINPVVLYMYKKMKLKFLVINKQMHSVYIRVKHHLCHTPPVRTF